MNIEHAAADEDYPATVIPGSLGVLSFCSANWRGDGSSPQRVVWLLKCCHGTARYIERVVVYVATDQDERIARALPGPDEVRRLRLERVPHPMGGRVYPLTVAALADARARLHDRDWIFFSEGDQIPFLRQPSRLLAGIGDAEYLVPHRFERLHQSGGGPPGRPIRRFRGRDYALWNTRAGPGAGPTGQAPASRAAGTYTAPDLFEAFAAAWLCRVGFLNTVDLDNWRHHVDREDGLPWTPMTTACHLLADHGAALKTVDPFDFFVEHLSGFENSLAAAGLRLSDLPGYW